MAKFDTISPDDDSCESGMTNIDRNKTTLTREERVKDALYKISEAAHSARDLQELFAYTHSIIGTLMPAENFYIAFFDAETQIMSYPYHADEVDDDWSSHKLEKTLSSYVLRTGSAMLVNPDAFNRLLETGDVESVGAPSIDWLGVPLKTRTETIGMMAVQTYRETIRLTEEDKNVLEFISTQVAMAIERKRSEELLRKNEEKYRVLVENSTDFIYRLDLNKRFTAANLSYCDSLGLHESDIVGKTREEIGCSRETAELWNSLLDQVITEGASIAAEMQEVMRDGWAHFFIVDLHPLHDTDGHVIGVSGNSRDITERKLAEDKVRASEARYRLLIETSQDAISLLTVDGVIHFCNGRMAELFGYSSPTELIGMSTFSLIQENSRELNREKWAEILETGSISDVELTLLKRDGQEFEGEVNATLLSNDDGSRQVMDVIRDITSRKKAELELLKAKERAEQSDKLKDSFIANISHEIRTPLNSIIGYIGLIELELADRMTNEEAEYFESIHRSGMRLMRTVEHILNIASMESNSFNITLETFDLIHRIENIVRDLQGLARKKALSLEFIHNNSDAYVNGDVYTIDQALINLVDNAIKFTPKGGVKVRVEQKDDTTTIYVEDTGIGISDEYQKRMFSVFSQEEVGYTRSFEGLGLGMALTKRYIEINHGTITVDSRKGEGSTFTVTFPSAHHRPAVKSALLDLEAGHDRNDGKAGHLLVVEDDEQSQNYMRAILSREYDLEVVDNANDAWNALTGKRYDLVLMDISLAGDEDGLQLTQRIRQERKISNVPVVALTAHAFPRDKQRSIEAGCNDYMTKPFQREALKALISKYIHG